MDGYCELHKRPWDIKFSNGQWAWECPMCRKQGVYDTYYDVKTTMKKQQEWTVNDHT